MTLVLAMRWHGHTAKRPGDKSRNSLDDSTLNPPRGEETRGSANGRRRQGRKRTAEAANPHDV